jgi:hypothetical protein
MTYTPRSISTRLKTIILIAISSLFVGCGSGGVDNELIPSEGSSIELGGSVVKGVVENGIVQAYIIEEQAGVMVTSTTPLATAVRTDANGRYQLKLPGNTKSSAVMVIMTADSRTTMTCDVVAGCITSDSVSTIAFGERLNLSDNFSLRNVMEASKGKRENFVHITPFTHLAIAWAEAEPGGLTAENIIAGKRYIETIFGLDTDALELAIPDITRLDQYPSLSKTELETAIMSASFLALVNSPDWKSIDEVLNYAAQTMSSSGSLSSTSSGTLPDVALDDLFYEAGEIVQGLLSDTNNTTQTALLNNIGEEVQQEYEDLSDIPETIEPVIITMQPSPLSVAEHINAFFIIQATGGGELAYQWRKDGVAITGANNTSYQLLDTTANQAGVYDVVVSNSVSSVISFSALLTVNVVVVVPTNTNPVAVNDLASTEEDISVTINVLANDSDSDGDSLSVTGVTSTQGSALINNDATITFIPHSNFHGTASITYNLSDGQGGLSTATVSITVSAVNDSPVGNNDAVSTLEDTPVSINVLANDTDIDGDTLDVLSASATNGSVSVSDQNILTFTPTSNFSGTGLITYSVDDGQGASAEATVTIIVSAVNDEPTASNDTAETVEDNSVTLNVLANDSDVDGDDLTVTSATVNAGTVTSNLENTLTFFPDTNFNGTATITYTVSDGKGGLATATARVNVTADNDAPIAENDTTSTDQNNAVTINALSNDFDVDGDSLTIVSATATYGNLVLEGSGVITYTPLQNFSGPDTITYTIDDSQGGASTATVSVTVNAVTTLSSIDLSWDIPFEREDGAALELYEIDGYMIAYGNSDSNLDSEIFVSGALVDSYLLENLSAGTYYFAIATIDSDGTQGDYSSTIIKTVM